MTPTPVPPPALSAVPPPAPRAKTAAPWLGAQLALLRRSPMMSARDAAAALSAIGPARTRGAVYRMRERMRAGAV